MATATAPDLDTLLPALAGGTSALVPAAALAGLWGLSEDDALDAAADLEAGGWLTTWAEGAWPVVVLTSRAAASLRLELEPGDTDDLERCRWVPVGESRPPDRARGRHRRETLETDLWGPGGCRRGPQGPGQEGEAGRAAVAGGVTVR